MKDEDIYKDRASQIQAIDKTFEQAKEKVSEFVKVMVLDIILEYHITIIIFWMLTIVIHKRTLCMLIANPYWKIILDKLFPVRSPTNISHI